MAGKVTLEAGTASPGVPGLLSSGLAPSDPRGGGGGSGLGSARCLW